jgi:hypothetical protein|tara:strand:- start:380 stop:985 length:606 start_codon:yes stop_codon:yes gene_type:complete
MSGQYPTTVNFRSTQFKDNRPTLLNQTLSGKKSVRQIGGQYFSFTVQMPPMKQENAQAYFAFLQKQKGSFEDFTIAAPLNNLGAGRLETDIQVVGSHTAADASIALDGFTASQTGALKAGDLIKFANHSKVYMVQSDIDANSSGALTVLISPNLVTALTDNVAVIVNKPQFTVYLESNEIMYSTDSSGFYNISFDVREVIT